MRLLTLHQPNLLVYFFSVLLLATLLLPKPSCSDPAQSPSQPSSVLSQDASSTAESLPEPKVEIRAPVETPPTEYLPYPPPPNYSWPAGENSANENPQPSENDPPAGWNTGQSGSSGSGSGSSSSTSRASPPLRPHVVLRLIASVLPVRARRDRISRVSSQTPLAERLPSVGSDNSEQPPGAIPAVDPAIKFDPAHTRSRFTGFLTSVLPGRFYSGVIPRAPVETPPTEYLPYPPPPNYNWPTGTSPNTENPPPSECDPPAGWYGGTGQTAPNCHAGGGSKPGAAAENGGPPPFYDDSDSKKIKWWEILLAVLGGLVFLALVTWALWRAAKRRKIKQQAAGGAPAPNPETEMTQDSEA